MRPFKFLPAPVTADNGGYDTFVKSAASSQAGLQALIHRVERPIVASYSRTISHPPIFGALTRKANPYGAVAILARKLAVTQPNDPTKLAKLNVEIGKALEKDHQLVAWYHTNPWETPPEDLWGSPEGAYE